MSDLANWYRAQQKATWAALLDKRRRAGHETASLPAANHKFDPSPRVVMRVLVANRGEIACKLICEVQRLGGTAIAVYSDADSNALHVSLADEALHLPGNTPDETYNNIEAVLGAVDQAQAQAVLPGSGFLSENPDMVEACEKRGVKWCGPTSTAMRAIANKDSARELAHSLGIKTVPGGNAAPADVPKVAQATGFPVLLKAAAGGGGSGQYLCHEPQDVLDALAVCKSGSWVVEKYLEMIRHCEIQIFGDGQTCIAVGGRDCSCQRKRQKIIEEGPIPKLNPAMVQAMKDQAAALGQKVGYRSAGTVEFVVQGEEFWFIEVNPRLQVEHGVTELLTGVPLVEWMLLEAAGRLNLTNVQPKQFGAAIQVRLCAEDVRRGFLPTTGQFTQVAWPSARAGDVVRLDTWVMDGTEVTPYYDNLCAKIIVWAPTRYGAIELLQEMLGQTTLCGVLTNREFCQRVLATPEFEDMRVHTTFLDTMAFQPAALLIEDAGFQTTIQDAGRLGYWPIGIPPSGAMDALAMGTANRLLGNAVDAPVLEMAVTGATFVAGQDCTVCLCGADMRPQVDGKPVQMWTPFRLGQNRTLKTGSISGCGARTYLAVAGGFACPRYLGSASTFVSGRFGGLHARAIQAGDQLPFEPEKQRTPMPGLVSLPVYGREWDIRVLLGPHGSTDFLTAGAIEEFFTSEYEVNHNSNRLGIRLHGPTPSFARADGGEAGLHPSNLHDYVYSVGALNLTGDLPVFITQDGPSLGGFVCPVNVPKAERWKLGQLAAHDTVRFTRITYDQARELAAQQQSWLSPPSLARHSRKGAEHGPPTAQHLGGFSTPLPPQNADPFPRADAIILEAGKGRQRIQIRMSGDEHVLVEYGDVELDFHTRFRVHALVQALEQSELPAEELSPGVRSLLVRYDPLKIDAYDLADQLQALNAKMPVPTKVPTRVIKMPMAFDDSATREALERYKTVRRNAPWMPSNVEFMRRINGLESIEDVKKVLYRASYMIFGLGDVYLNAPCAVPVDPRDRLVTSKFNPARTYTAEGTVGIGGVYMCIYGMDSPGGYQLVGRTLPIYDAYSQIPAGRKLTKNPWLFSQFDQVQYYEVSEPELHRLRQQFRLGQLQLDVKEETFDLDAHDAFLTQNAASIRAFQAAQSEAYAAERARWEEFDFARKPSKDAVAVERPKNGCPVPSPVRGNVAQWLVQPGQHVKADEKVCVVEAMKMQLTVRAPVAGVLGELSVEVGSLAEPNQTLAYIESQGKGVTSLSVHHLHAMYRLGVYAPTDVFKEVLKRMEQTPHVWVSKADAAAVLAQAAALDAELLRGPDVLVEKPLFGVPFGVKDNIDVAGMSTTAGCPKYAYRPEASATAVAKVLEAGAICVGKTNLDQFATGLVGVWSPHGAPANAINKDYVPGGSSSGSAVAVADQQVSFALGTDTAGSGRVPAAFNGLVGLKPSKALVSTAGVVPCIQSLDCVAVFAKSVGEASVVLACMAGVDAKDPYTSAAIERPLPQRIRFGTPRFDELEFCGDQPRALAFKQTLRALKALGTVEEVDFAPFRRVAGLIDTGPWAAARALAVRPFVEEHADDASVDPTAKQVVLGSKALTATDVVGGLGELQRLTQETKALWGAIDVMVVPSTPTMFTVEQVKAEPMKCNALLGTYTSFVDLLGLCALTLPAGSLPSGLPASITCIAPEFDDPLLAQVGRRWEIDQRDRQARRAGA